jgi:hypothetical protein
MPHFEPPDHLGAANWHQAPYYADIAFPEVGSLHHRYERSVNSFGDRTGMPVSAWTIVPHYNTALVRVP